MDQRIIELESKLAFQEDEIEKLSEAIIHQQQQIERLEIISKTLAERLRSLVDTTSPEVNPEDEVPPHY